MTISFFRASKLIIILFIVFGFFFFINQALACESAEDCGGDGWRCNEGDCEMVFERSGSDDDSDDEETDSGRLNTEEGDPEDGDPDNGREGPNSSSNYGLDSVPSELPRDNIVAVIMRIIRYVIGLVGILLLIMLIYGGVMYMTSAGNEEQAKKAKNVLTYASWVL